MPGSAEDTLKYCIECGISSIELMGSTAELYAGLPQPPERWSDEEIDYAFNAAKALGARGVSTEIGEKSCEKLHDRIMSVHI
jgi:hypothetical protein